MKAYNREDWGISKSEYNRLVEAVEQGILPNFTVEGRRYDLKNGYITADQLIRAFDHSGRFHSKYTQSRDCIGEREFQHIVAEVLNRSNDVYKYEFFNMAVQITLYSRSKKSKWNTFLDFNDHGRITGKYTYTQGYLGAAQPWVIGDEIQRRVTSALYD